MDYNLSVNLTILYLYSSFGSECSKGNVSLFDDFVPFKETRKWKVLLSYCGQYSSLNVYPGVSKLQISAIIHPQMIRIMDAIFSIFDKNSARSFKMASNKVNLISQNLFKNNKLVLIFALTVRKSCNIKLTVHLWPKRKFIMYDGPGFLSRTVTAVGNVYKSSTSQCVLRLSQISRPINHMNFNLLQFPWKAT